MGKSETDEMAMLYGIVSKLYKSCNESSLYATGFPLSKTGIVPFDLKVVIFNISEPYYSVFYEKDNFRLWFYILQTSTGSYDVWNIKCETIISGKSWMPVREILDIFKNLQQEIRDDKIDKIIK